LTTHALAAGPFDRYLQAALLCWRMVVYRGLCYVLSHLTLLKMGFAVLRRVRPVAIFGSTLVLTKQSDVREVLRRFNDFTLGQSIAPGMPWGSFLMTVDWVQQHAQERQLLESVVRRPADIHRAGQIAGAQAAACIGRAAGRIDVVTELAEPVMVAIAADYFGVPPPGGSPATMAQIMRDLAGIIMVNPPVGSQPWTRSRDGMAALTNHLLHEIAATKTAIQGPHPAALPDNLFTRLVQLLCAGGQPAWFTEDWIRCYLTGLVATGAATVVRATTHAVDQLVAHPIALQRAQRAAEAAAAGSHAQTLKPYIYEALRFRPMLPVLVRDCPRDTIIANGTARARVVPGGTRVIAGPLAAMFDPDAVPMPSRFDVGRPAHQYIHFGHGPRHCFGEYVADTVMMEIIPALLRLPRLARAAGSAGKVQYEGPVCSSLVLTFA
jgi:cytochrome P450